MFEGGAIKVLDDEESEDESKESSSEEGVPVSGFVLPMLL